MNTIPTNEFPLWPEGAPDAHGKEAKDIPTLTPFLPDPAKATGACIIVFPGGGYTHLAPHEGEGYAKFLASQGIVCFVLKYRLSPYRHPSMLNDASRAVRYVRAHATGWGIDPLRIGIIGSSAGGHLAATLITHSSTGDANSRDPIDRVSSRPDLAILCYPVITMGADTHEGSKADLLGANPSPELVLELSNELHVTPHTPPCFIWHTLEDLAVKVENSLVFASALRRSGVQFDLHIYQRGVHGIGLSVGLEPGSLHPWTDDCIFWLNAQGFLGSNT